MHTLHPFTPLAIRVHAEITFAKDEVRLRFELAGALSQVLDPPVAGSYTKTTRADELWRTTCLEAFWGRPGEKGYWELNVAPAGGRWNLYHFDDYRLPQPPRANQDFEMLAIETTATSMTCRLRPHVTGPFEASLCAVIRTEAGPTYFATHHAGAKADFHERRSFVVT